MYAICVYTCVANLYVYETMNVHHDECVKNENMKNTEKLQRVFKCMMILSV